VATSRMDEEHGVGLRARVLVAVRFPPEKQPPAYEQIDLLPKLAFLTPFWHRFWLILRGYFERFW
jgi:hypothetical protein